MTNPGRRVWWKGERGEWLVVGQVVLMTLVFLGPRTLSDGPTSPVFRSGVPWYAGAAWWPVAPPCFWPASFGSARR